MATWHAPLEFHKNRWNQGTIRSMLYCYTQISISASNVHYFEPTICGCLEWQEAVLIDPSLNRTEAYLELLDEAGINLKRLELAMNAVIFSPERQDQEPWPCHPVVKPISWGMWSTHTATMTTSVPQAAASQCVTCFACSGGSHWSLRLVPSFWGKMSGKEPVSVVEGLHISQPGGCVFVLPSKILRPEDTAGSWQRKIEEKPSDPPWPWEHIQSWWMIIQFHQESATNPAELTFAVTSPASIISIACWKSAFAWMCCPIQKILYFNNK